MRHIILLLTLFAMDTLLALAHNEVPLVVQITEDERSALPDKTLESQVKVMKFGKKANLAFVEGLIELMNKLVDTDESNYVYLVTLKGNNQQTISVSIQSTDLFTKPRTYYGTMIVSRRHFVFERTDDNEQLLKSLLTKDGKKINYVREYEVVEFKQERNPALLQSQWHDGEMELNYLEVNGELLINTK